MRFDRLRRREFITLLCGTATAWPLAARAQPAERMRTVGILLPTADDAEGRARLDAFRKGLQSAGWIEGVNIRLEPRFASADADSLRGYANELVGLKPNVILTGGGRASTTMQRATKAIPIVFVGTADPVGLGLIESLARPGGNITGFAQTEVSVAGKLLEILKEVTPNLTHPTFIHHVESVQAAGFIRSIESVASSLNVSLTFKPVRDRGGIHAAISDLETRPSGGLIVPSDSYVSTQVEFIVSMTAQYRLPAIYGFRSFVPAGGLMYYGHDLHHNYFHAAGYVDRILKGARPTDLPVQAPTKFALAINLKAAKALGLSIPPLLLARADEVIE